MPEFKEIGNEASQTTRTYPITLIMDQPEGIEILPGMTGRATGRGDLPGAAADGVFEVPASAVFLDDDGQSCVWIVDEAAGTVRRHPVTTDRLSARRIQVQGLEPGQVVATAGVHYLEEGQRVRLLAEAGEAAP